MEIDWMEYDWDKIVTKLPEEKNHHYPFIADDHLLYLFLRDNRASYLMEGVFVGSHIGDSRDPHPRWKILTTFNALASFLKQRGYGNRVPEWLANFADYRSR
ncbi:MAG: hypothetical protein PHP02_01585 [Eubacteriales bacterium]|nr:hypothetical protein [Eubacteriales bacterium]